jgi:hypothetical protein
VYSTGRFPPFSTAELFSVNELTDVDVGVGAGDVEGVADGDGDAEGVADGADMEMLLPEAPLE